MLTKWVGGSPAHFEMCGARRLADPELIVCQRDNVRAGVLSLSLPLSLSLSLSLFLYLSLSLVYTLGRDLLIQQHTYSGVGCPCLSAKEVLAHERMDSAGAVSGRNSAPP